MFLTDYFNANPNQKQLAKDSQGFQIGYDYWKEILFERACRLFNWDTKNGVPNKEIEKTLMLNGTCGIARYDGKLTAFSGQYGGAPTIYYDEYTDYMVHSPIYSKSLKVNQDIIVINNNACRNSIYPLVHRYAIMLAHTEVTLIDVLIESRIQNGVPIGRTTKEQQTLQNWRNSLCNGKVVPILDEAFAGIKFVEVPAKSSGNIQELMETRKNLLQSYYNDLGVRTSNDKKGNMIEEEITSNDQMLLLNLDDMLQERQIACEKINNLFGTEWSVSLSNALIVKEADENVEHSTDI